MSDEVFPLSFGRGLLGVASLPSEFWVWWQDTLNPKWNSNCQFFIKDLEQDVLCVTVFERDQFSPDGRYAADSYFRSDARNIKRQTAAFPFLLILSPFRLLGQDGDPIGRDQEGPRDQGTNHQAFAAPWSSHWRDRGQAGSPALRGALKARIRMLIIRKDWTQLDRGLARRHQRDTETLFLILFIDWAVEVESSAGKLDHEAARLQNFTSSDKVILAVRTQVNATMWRKDFFFFLPLVSEEKLISESLSSLLTANPNWHSIEPFLPSDAQSSDNLVCVCARLCVFSVQA